MGHFFPSHFELAKTLHFFYITFFQSISTVTDTRMTRCVTVSPILLGRRQVNAYPELQ